MKVKVSERRRRQIRTALYSPLKRILVFHSLKYIGSEQVGENVQHTYETHNRITDLRFKVIVTEHKQMVESSFTYYLEFKGELRLQVI